MIYALRNENQAAADCLEIAQAIENNDAGVIEQWVKARVIVHVKQANEMPESLYCIYCRDAVKPTADRPPKGRSAANPWHFEHDNLGDCIGRTRNPPALHALGIENPANHGCYVLLGCEATPQRDRTACQTIIGGHTYCHLARTMMPPCV